MQKHNITRPDGYIDRSPQGFANRYGFSLSHTYNLMRSGELKARKSRRRTIISEDDEQEWLDSLERYIPEAKKQTA